MHKEALLPDSKKILLVDDDGIIRSVLYDFLTSIGHQVTTAHDGHDGLSKFTELYPALDAVITDILMPNCNGIELTQAIREHAPDLPVLMLTGYSEPEHAEMAIRLGATIYNKPVHLADIKIYLDSL